jgi:peptide/nickel transport system substrate-binding protein
MSHRPLRPPALRSSATGAAALAATLFALAAAPAAAQAPNVLRVRFNADIRSTDPGVNRDANTDGVVLHLVEGLVALREDTSIGPLLASKVDMAPDGKTYTFTLREGVKFHNGAPLTADDVLWAWKRYLDPQTNWRCLSEFDGRGLVKIVAVEAPDPRTVVFRLDSASALFLATMARMDCGGSGIVHRSSLGADGKWAQPVGTGPFRLGEWKRGQSIELLRFDGYLPRTEPASGYTGAKKAEVERVRFVIIPDSAAAKAALLAGQIDVLTDASSADLAELRARPDVKVEVSPSMGLNGLLIQTRDPLLKDVRVRRALALAIDTEQLAESVSEGLAKRNNSPVPSTSPFHTAVQAQGFKPDLAEARRLLAAAGYAGQPIKLITNKRYPSMFDSAVLVQGMAQQAGIKIELEVLDWATQLDRYTKGDYALMSFSYSARLDPALNFEMLMGPKDKQPRKVWDNPEAQARLAVAMDSADRAQRQAVFDELHRRVLEEVPMIVFYNGAEVAALRRNVLGYRGWPAGQPRLFNVRFQ